jgi:lipoprotein-anchoring transpeptidase ErfK/SrfK
MRAATCGLAREISRRGRREYRATVCVNDATRAGRLANHNVVAIAPQKNIKAALHRCGAAGAFGFALVPGCLCSGDKTMRHMRASLATACLLLVAPAAPMAAAQEQGPCGQIRAACQGAGFVEGAARDGIGLQVHCVMPIMRGSAQPSTARRPLPQVDPRLVTDCKASRSRFGRLLPPSDDVLRPPMPMRSGQRAMIAGLPPEDQPETGPARSLPPQLRRAMIDYPSKEPAGTIIVDTSNTYLYLVLGNGKAMRYGIGVGREGFTWSGAEKVTKMAEWPDWHPPEGMIERQPYLPRFMAGGEGNPLGARALYLGQTLYRIHGTNQPSTIGTFVSSGCIRLTNEDITDLYDRVKVGTRVVVLPAVSPVQAPATASPSPAASPRSKAAAAAKPPARPAPAARPQAPPAQAAAGNGEAAGKDITGAIAAPPPAPAAPPLNQEALNQEE